MLGSSPPPVTITKVFDAWSKSGSRACPPAHTDGDFVMHYGNCSFFLWMKYSVLMYFFCGWFFFSWGRGLFFLFCLFYFCMSFFSFLLLSFDKNKVIKFLLVFLKPCHVTLGNIYRFISRRAMLDGKYNTSRKSDAIEKFRRIPSIRNKGLNQLAR